MSKSSVTNKKWVACDLTKIFSLESLHKLSEEAHYEPLVEPVVNCAFPDFGANLLQQRTLTHLCGELGAQLHQVVTVVSDVPSVIVADKMCSVWDKVFLACSSGLYSTNNVKDTLKSIQKDDKDDTSTKSSVVKAANSATSLASQERVTGNSVLLEVGVKTSLSVIFTLLKQAWAQLLWQKQMEQALSGSLPFGPAPVVNLSNEVLKSVLDVLTVIPPLSLSNPRAISNLSQLCVKQSTDFLQWIVSPTSLVDAEGKSLALQIMLILSLQHGSLLQLLKWVEGVISLLICYEDLGGDVTLPPLDAKYCNNVLKEIRTRTKMGSMSPEGVEEPPIQVPTESGHICVVEFLQILLKELSEVSHRCTSYFCEDNLGRKEHFLSDTCDVYGFGSNSSNQLGIRTGDKFPKPAIMPQMENVQVITCGHYCSFLIYSDGSVKACGKGSYGRLGMGSNESQVNLTPVHTFPQGVIVRTIACSKGSDGHSLAVTADGNVYSWGDGNYWKLGHGDSDTQKSPKLISFLVGKNVRDVSCANKHSAAVTVEGDLYTWGEGEFGRLGHGTSSNCKLPTLVSNIGAVKQVACGVAHTLAVSMDGLTVWSFGSGDLGKLGHGDTTKQLSPKCIEALKGSVYQKVCAANQFSLVLTAGGNVYSFGNGSGVGLGTTEPRQLTPCLIEPLEKETIIDICTGDGHCLALTQRGEVYSWGTNSMGQCGQGHTNGSILKPTKVPDLDGVHVQQISAGTSHSLVWTAIPSNRQASALWYWPYCISVEQDTFQVLLSLLEKFGHFQSKEPIPPFHSIELQESFVLSLLCLVRTHLSLVAPVGLGCIDITCGNAVKPLRNLLFQLIDSHLPLMLDMETSAALEVGSSVLLPPVQDRLELLLSILPEDPASIAGLSTGQRRQLDILLSGFSERGELVSLFAEEVDKLVDLIYDGIDFTLINKLFDLNHKMVQYINRATLCSLHGEPLPQDIRLGSPLLNSFQDFITSTYIHVLVVLNFIHDSFNLSLSEQGKTILIHHLSPFDHIVRETSLSVLAAIESACTEADDPSQFLQGRQDVLFGFLAYQFPCHVALCFSYPTLDILCNVGDLLLDVAKSIHRLINFLPPHIVLELEREELLWERKEDKFDFLTLHQPCDHPWRKLADYERLLCYCSAKIIYEYISQPCGEEQVLDYILSVPGTGEGRMSSRPSLMNSHLLRNGAVGGEEDIAQALYIWASLCKTLPGNASFDKNADEYDPPTLNSWSSFMTDYHFLLKSSSNDVQILDQDASVIEPLDLSTAPVLYALAVGGTGNEPAMCIYRSMMEYAQHRDWNTCSDEDAVPELKQVSCAALACLLKHTGLSHIVSHSGSKPRKKLLDTYRHVFSLRHEVFTHRPIPDNEGKISPDDKEKFRLQCNGICTTLMLLMCILEAAIPKETDPIIPSKDKPLEEVESSNPGSPVHHPEALNKQPVRILSYSQVEDLKVISGHKHNEKKMPSSIVHSLSLTPSPSNSHPDISLSGVKQALSYLRWHRDRLDHLEASSNSGSEGSPCFTICSTIINIASQVFAWDGDNTLGKKSQVNLLHRTDLIKVLIEHQRRAEIRQISLKKALQFFKMSDSFLPSSQIIFKATCLKHYDMHYLDHITVAPSVLQHEVKSLNQELFQLVIDKLLTVTTADLMESSVTKDPTLSQLPLKRELLLALQWINFNHQASDLQFLFTGELYTKIAELSCVPSTEVAILPCLSSSSTLWDKIKKSSTLMMQMLALQVGLNADILKSSSDILDVVSRHLFGQLRCLVEVDDVEIAKRWKDNDKSSMEMRDTLLEDFLRFLNTLSATHVTIRALLSSDHWFRNLLKIVCLDSNPGKSVVTSLKTRLLALQLLGVIMSEHADKSVESRAKSTKIIEDLFELMFHCMYVTPVASIQQAITKTSVLSLENEAAMKELPGTIPFEIDHNHQVSVQCTTEDNGCVAVSFDHANSGYFIGRTPMTVGKYTWKCTIESSRQPPNFVVGVSRKPLTNPVIETSDEIWAVSNRGSIFHGGESDYNMMFTQNAGSSLELEFDVNTNQGTFSCNYGSGIRMVLRDVCENGDTVYPVFMFFQDATEPSPAKLIFHPIKHVCPSPLINLRHQEQLESGYPHLSPTSTTLSQAIVSLLYQLQGKEVWSKSIGQVISNRLMELESLVHGLLSIEEKLSQSSDTSCDQEAIISSLSVIMTQLTQIVWPALAVIGGLDSGFCLGRLCHLEGTEEGREEKEVLVTSVPDSALNVQVQEKVAAQTSQIITYISSLSSLHLIPQTRFSLPLIVDQMTPAMLLNLAHLAGYLDQHSIPAILRLAHSGCSVGTKDFVKSLPFQLISHSILQIAATKSLYTILSDELILNLLSYQSPSLEAVVEGGCEDKSELALAVKDVISCLSSRAIKPSPLKSAIKLLELQKLHSTLSYESITSLADNMPPRSDTTAEISSLQTPDNVPPSDPRSQDYSNISVGSSCSESSGVGRNGEGGDDGGAPLPTIPHITTVMVEMGFSHPQIRVALANCEIPENTEDRARIEALISWIIDHPNTATEQELQLEGSLVDQEAEAEQRQREANANQSVVSDQFFNLIEAIFDPSTSLSDEGEHGGEEIKPCVLHAPGLLDGPDINEEVSDINLDALDTSAKSLLSALGLSQKRPSPQTFQFSNPDPMGETLFQVNRENESESTKRVAGDCDREPIKISTSCYDLLDQVKLLKSTEENIAALNRIAAGTQALVARKVILGAIASYSTRSPSDLISSLKSLNMLDIKSLVYLLRLIHASRIDGTPDKSYSISTPSNPLGVNALECVSNTINTVIVEDSTSAGTQLMQSCSRDIFAAAVGGTELIRRTGRRRRNRAYKRFNYDNSDLSVLANPNFEVSRKLMQTIAKSTGKLAGNDLHNKGVLQMTDSLAACLFSSKLKPSHRFWALEQLIRIFTSSNGATPKKGSISNEDLEVPSKLQHLTGHKAQILACVKNSKEKKAVTIGEDNCVLLWNFQSGSLLPEITTLPFPFTPSQSMRGLFLPTLTQSCNENCVAGAVDDTLCVWKVKDGKNVVQTFPELITALKFKPSQNDGDFPMILIGLIDGGLVLAEVIKTSVNFVPEIQITASYDIKGGAVCSLCWSMNGARFAVGSTSGHIEVFGGADRDYSLVTDIKDVQASYLCWSPDSHYLTVLAKHGVLQLWSSAASDSSLSVAHSFGAYPTSSVQWHSEVAGDGAMLLASGGKDGKVHLWLVKRAVTDTEKVTNSSDAESTSSMSGVVSHVATLEGHPAAISCLAFNEGASLLASGCVAGSVRVWDVSTFALLKFATRVSEVIDLEWIEEGLAICYKNTSSLCLLFPGPDEYLGERSLCNCLPALHHYSIADLNTTPCLAAFLKNLHHMLLDQYQYERNELISSQQLVFSEYLQLLTALAVGLGLHSVLISPPYPPHMPRPPTPKEWVWLFDFTNVLGMAESLFKRTSFLRDSGFVLPENKKLDPSEKYQPTANCLWTLQMDSEILEWTNQRPEDWWSLSWSSVYTWGKGSWNQLGHSTRESFVPNLVVDWKDFKQVVAGSYCTYAVKFDGSVCSVGEGSYGRLGHGGSENETSMRIISLLQGIPVIHVVAGPRVSVSTDDGFALALTDTGDVYSWGKGYKGRLGHRFPENVRSPKIIDALASKDIKMISCCDYHCAVVTECGTVYTFGSKDNGKLGLGRDVPSGSTGHVDKVTTFYAADEQTQIMDVKIGYVSTGQLFTLAITEDGSQVYAWGKADYSAFGLRDLTGDFYHPILLSHLNTMGPFVKAVSGNRSSSLLTADGRVCTFGKLYDGMNQGIQAEYVVFPNEAKIVDISTAACYTLALTETGDVYYWGRSQYGTSTSGPQRYPKLIQNVSGKGMKQISAAVRHCVACDTNLPVKGESTITTPSAVPTQYSSLRGLSCDAIYTRLMLLNYFSKLVSKSWTLFSTMNKNKAAVTKFHLNPLSDGGIRSLISSTIVEGMVAGVISRTMTRKSHGPAISIQRINTDTQNPSGSEQASKSIFCQAAPQILLKSAADFRCPTRAWKVNLLGEGADDAGGVFDETIAQMCEELETGIVKLFIPTPNATNKCGFNTDRFVVNPKITVAKDYKYLKFLGILFGVAMRTKKPLDLHLAQPMWKLLAGMNLTTDDLEEVDLMFIQMLYGIRDADKGGIKEEDFSEMIPIESFEALSMSGMFVPISQGSSSTRLTFQNRREYVEKALYFRLHELDDQVAVIREGMASIIPLPLISLYTAKMLEFAVCGKEQVDLSMLKKVVRYRDGTTHDNNVVQWLWQTLESFPNDEKILFLRFVSGRSRLPIRISDIPQRFQISVSGQSSDSLPTSQTCFFQLRIPNYRSQEVLCERLRYAIRNCRSIDMDNYMLRRSGSHNDLIPYSDDDDDDDEDYDDDSMFT